MLTRDLAVELRESTSLLWSFGPGEALYSRFSAEARIPVLDLFDPSPGNCLLYGLLICCRVPGDPTPVSAD